MQETVEIQDRESQPINLAVSQNGKSELIEPDLEFIKALAKSGGDQFKLCMQCGTCSGTCQLSPDHSPFPSKEMAWANWGMKSRLMRDVDIWLCFQCNDCSARCPRGAKPGDVLAAIRQQSIQEYAFPRFMGRLANQPSASLLLLGISVILLSLALYIKNPIEKVLGISGFTESKIVFNYSNMFPHWLINSFFFIISAVVLTALIIGVRRFWRTLKTSRGKYYNVKPVKSLWPSLTAAAYDILIHKNFNKCTVNHHRYWTHMSVFFGFFALLAVTFWIITSSINPLTQDGFVYPFGFFSPWKMLANLGGLALMVGLAVMMYERMSEKKNTSASSYFDWTLVAMLFIVTITGFITEALHYVRLEPHRHLAYFVHLMFVCTLILYLPYSKFAHVVYRTVALVYAEYTGRKIESAQTEIAET
jgi:quinone-modifying oxidoreductase subunit QmoC